MREAIIVLEQKRLCPICAGRMKTCKVNVEGEGRVFRCPSCDLRQSETNALPVRVVVDVA
jgi:tRNA(Ile2) C34 agmatinyltransferase TiaS